MSPLWIVLVLLPLFGAGERFSCRGRILGGYYADVKSGCRAFHVCVRVAGGGIRDFRFFCPPGTLFQQEAQTCTDWGDDDGLACPADLYDGQFDLYKIGSGFDTKKVPSRTQHDDDADFSLQRAETGDRRLSTQPQPAQPQADLRAAHSSDFFSGRRDRGRDDAPDTPTPTSPPAPPATRAPYRRPPPRSLPRSSTFAPQPTPQPSSTSPSTYEPQQKRKVIRKRPIHVISSTVAPAEYTIASRQYFRSTKSDYEKFSTPSSAPIETPRGSYNEDSGFVDVIKVNPKVGRYDAPSDKAKYNANNALTEIYNYNAQSTPNYNNFNKNQNYNQNYNVHQNNNFQSQNNDESFNNKNGNLDHQNNNFNKQNNIYNNKNNNYNSQNYNINNQNKELNNANHQNINLNNPNADINNNENPNNHYNNFKKSRSENNGEFKATVRNNFSVAPPADFTAENEVRKNVEVSPNGVQRPSSDYDKSTRNIGSSTPSYRNFNSVSYDAEKSLNTKNSFVSSTTPDYEKTRNTPLNLNTVAYKTNLGFDAHPASYAESEEDDGQYKPPSGEDDGQYRPELYERDRELLSGAHSLNIAASKNRLPEDQKPRRTELSAQTAAPRPFSAAPNTPPPRPTGTFQYPTTSKSYLRPRITEYSQTYPTTPKPEPTQQTTNYQSYTSTGKSETSAPAQTTFEYANSVFTTRRPVTPAYVPTTYYSPAPSSVEPQPFKHEPARPAPAQKPHQHAISAYAKSVKSPKEDISYDYAYYDSDSGFSDYEQVEEFEKTKSKA